MMSTRNNQVIYGRRGTGKTHALKYLAEHVVTQNELPIYMDLRTIGSSSSIYSDPSQTLSTRAATLIVDVLTAIHSELTNLAIEQIDGHPDPGQLTLLLDNLRQSISTFRITGTATESSKAIAGRERSLEGGLKGSISDISAKFGFGSKSNSSIEETSSLEGDSRLHLDFGNIAASLRDLIERLNVDHVWLLLDEWSEVPFDLQPFLADLLRRTVVTVRNVTLKIAAIEHRSVFSLQRPNGEYVGLELGADIFADVNLDNFLVFDNDQTKATDFFKTLLYRHYKNIVDSLESIHNPDILIGKLFTQWPAFEEFVRAVEGVPRDALNLCSAAVSRAFGQLIAVNDVRTAARDWYQQDKAAITRTTPELQDALAMIVDEVIGKRRARAFLYASNSRHLIIDQLFDARLLHILKRNVSSNDEPGSRYDVYKIDDGCYVELINTTRAPEALFTVDDDEAAEVPKDDYRSIRRAILREEDLKKIPASMRI